MGLVLASKSPYRKAQLDSLGLEFSVADSQVNEDELKAKISNPRDLCESLATLKARSVAELQPADSIVIGADQLIHYKGKVFGKPGSPEKALEQLMALQGETHELITSICLVSGKEVRNHTDVSEVTLRNLNEDQLKAYIKSDQSWDCSGSYKIEQNGLVLMEKIETLDHTSVIGLPMMTLISWLIEFKIKIPCLV